MHGIFAGKIANWREEGGKDETSTALSHSPNSGTYLYLQEHVLEGREYGDQAMFLPTTSAIVAEIERNPQAIGYGGLAYGPQLVHCNINGVAPTEENVRNNTYPISRYLYFYTLKKPEGAVKRFMDWVLSREGQRLVKEVNYIPLIKIP